VVFISRGIKSPLQRELDTFYKEITGGNSLPGMEQNEGIVCRQDKIGIRFCMRMKEYWWLDVKEFSESGREQKFVSFGCRKKTGNC